MESENIEVDIDELETLFSLSPEKPKTSKHKNAKELKKQKHSSLVSLLNLQRINNIGTRVSLSHLSPLTLTDIPSDYCSQLFCFLVSSYLLRRSGMPSSALMSLYWPWTTYKHLDILPLRKMRSALILLHHLFFIPDWISAPYLITAILIICCECLYIDFPAWWHSDQSIEDFPGRHQCIDQTRSLYSHGMFVCALKATEKGIEIWKYFGLQ